MATTTNYGWATPDDTDLVKDGAAAIRTLGTSIDTSFAADEGDLLVGGTSDIFEALPIGAAGTVLTSDGDTAEWVAPAGIPVVLNAQTATYTVVLGDAFKLVTMSNAAANDFLIPTNANVAFPVGTVINVVQIGAGKTTIEAVTPGTTTISSTASVDPDLRAQFSAASCIKTGTDTWLVVGDIA